MTFGPLVSTEWLAAHLDDADVKIVDGSWRMPGQGAAIETYNAQHIPGAVFFDIDAIADQRTHLPHMLPSPSQFAQAMEDLGISDQDRVVVYDEKGLFSAARVWWTFRAMGHETVAVLDGGLPRWRAEGRPVTAEKTIPIQMIYTPRPQPGLVADAAAVREALKGAKTVIDARSAERFAGKAADPRPGVRAGHMPGARNTPFLSLLDGDALKPVADLSAIFTDAGITPETPVITSCGSGVTAAVLSLALELTGSRSHALYDGSWSEWGEETNDDAIFPVVADTDG